jgi:hypothetical protein
MRVGWRSSTCSTSSSPARSDRRARR